jgi:secreted trypsin-like serine protease
MNMQSGLDGHPVKPQAEFDVPAPRKPGTPKPPVAAEHVDDGSGILRATTIPIIGQLTENEFVHLQDKSGVSSGDSGGPVFLKVGNELQVWGVTNAGTFMKKDNGKLVQIAIHTSVEHYIPWIKATVPKLGGTLVTIH